MRWQFISSELNAPRAPLFNVRSLLFNPIHPMHSLDQVKISWCTLGKYCNSSPSSSSSSSHVPKQITRYSLYLPFHVFLISTFVLHPDDDHHRQERIPLGVLFTEKNGTLKFERNKFRIGKKTLYHNREDLRSCHEMRSSRCLKMRRKETRSPHESWSKNGWKEQEEITWWSRWFRINSG